MRGLIVASSLLLTFAVTPAHPGRPLTDQEKTKLEAALAAQGAPAASANSTMGCSRSTTLSAPIRAHMI